MMSGPLILDASRRMGGMLHRFWMQYLIDVPTVKPNSVVAEARQRGRET